MCWEKKQFQTVDEIVNTLPYPIIVYSSTGDKILLQGLGKTRYLPGIYYIVRDEEYDRLKGLGQNTRQLVKAKDYGKDRDGLELTELRTFDSDIRVYPRGQ